MTVASFLLLTVCPALLPAADAVDWEYYAVLGLLDSSDGGDGNNNNSSINDAAARSSSSPQQHHDNISTKRAASAVSAADVRRAYKAKSLLLHPDKVAQRVNSSNNSNGSNANAAAAAAAADYERVQEAAAVLSDRAKRRAYHDYGCSVSRYRFVHVAHGLSNPVALHEQLQQARCAHQTRLVALTAALVAVALVQPVLVAAKINAIFDGGNATSSSSGHALLSHAPWSLVLLPCWLALSLYIGSLTVAVVVTGRHHQRKQAPTAPSSSSAEAAAASALTDENFVELLLQWLQSVVVLIGLVLLVQQWDRPTLVDRRNWHRTAVPWYGLIVLRVLSLTWHVSHYRRLQARMISVEHLQRTEGVDDWNDVTDEQRDALLQRYVVVESDPASVARILQMLRDDNDALFTDDAAGVEAVRVQCSDEWQATEAAANDTYRGMGSVVLIGTPLVALIASKLQGQIASASWWIVFIPLWVSLGLPLLQHAAVCCCGTLPDLDDSDEDADSVVVTEMNVPAAAGPPDAADEELGGGSAARHGDPHGGDGAGARRVGAATTTTTARASSAQFASTEGSIDDFNTASKRVFHARPNAAAAVDDDDDRAAADGEASGGTEDEPSSRQHPPADQRELLDQKLKAISGCCTICFQLVLLCLTVAKLEADYDAAVIHGDTSDGGFNAFWILFPVFFVAAIVLACCACCIYASPPPRDGAAYAGDDEEAPAAATADAAKPESTNAPAIIASAAPLASIAELSSLDDRSSLSVGDPASSHGNNVAVNDEPAVASAAAVANDVETGGSIGDLD